VELAKLIVSVFTPVTIVVVGFFVQRALAERNRIWKIGDRLADKRMETYGKIGLDLNTIYCYVEDIGGFKDETPDSIIAAKRSVDRTMFVYQAIWPEQTFKCFKEYMDSAFEPYGGGAGKDARIRAQLEEKRAAFKEKWKGKEWDPNWDRRFTGERDQAHDRKYQELIKLLSKDLGLGNDSALHVEE